MGRRRRKPQTNNNVQPTTARARLANASNAHFGGERDLYKTFGYPTVLSVEDYRGMYERGGIAGRIIDAYPDATWREAPKLDTSEAFVESFDAMAKRLKLWSVLQRLDRLTQLGHYGVLLLGLDGAEPLDSAAVGGNYRLMYLQPHGEQTAKISKWCTDTKSARFGKPELYRVTVGPNWEGAGGGEKSLLVHHTRVIHVAEDALEHESIGIPRLQRIYNRLMDMEKLLGGSAEMYWQNTAMLLAFLADKDVTWAPGEAEKMGEQLDEMQHNLRRALRLRGVEVQNIAPGLMGSDPEGHMRVQLDQVAGASGIPKRILTGNEAGELASSQDENAWQGRVAERRNQFATPSVLQPLLESGKRLGFLPNAPVVVEWPESDTLGEKGRAEVANQTAQAVAAFANIMGDPAVTEDEFRAVLGLDPRPPQAPETPLDESDPDVQEAFAERKRRDAARPNPDADTTPEV